MELDKSGLEGRIFEGFAATSTKRYVYLCNMTTGVSRWSKNAVEYFDLPGEFHKNAGMIWAEKIHPEDRPAFLKSNEEIFSGKTDFHEMEYRVLNREGDYVVVTCRGVVMRGTENEHDLFLATISNHGITENIDSITSLHNVYGFWNQLAKYKGSKTSSVLILMGVNNFSQINGIYGYAFGDKVLKNIAKKLQECLGEHGKLFRMDGIRFSCLLPNHTPAEAENVFNHMKEALRKGIIVNELKFSFVLAGGALAFAGDFEETAVQTGVTYALQKSKYDKGGELVFFDNKMNEDNQKNLKLLEELRKSMDNDYTGFYLNYQPTVSSEDSKLMGAEALLRWRHDDYGEVPPGVFIPWLENDPRFFELGNWILKRAMEQTMPLLEKYPDFMLHVNIAYPQIARVSFKNAVQRILNETGYPAKNLCLELTERCRQLESSYLRKELEYLKVLGISIAIDDFGTGFSSLNLLSEIPVDLLKIDRGFIFDIMTNKANQMIVKAVTTCADDLDIDVCVEGLEDQSMIDFMKAYHTHSYQGYFFSRPIPMENFTEKYM